jgi:uncharacterized membrane protein
MFSPSEQSVLVARPESEVWGRLCDVEAWSSFLTDVEGVSGVGPERYDFVLVEAPGRRPQVCRVAVRRHPRHGSIHWTSLTGSHYTGSLRVTPAGDGTRVELKVSHWPSAAAAALLDSLVPKPRPADERRLLQYLEHGQVPA